MASKLIERTDEAYEGDEKLTIIGRQLVVGEQASKPQLYRQEGPFEKQEQLSWQLYPQMLLLSFVNAVSTPICYSEARLLHELCGDLDPDRVLALTISLEPTRYLAGWENCLAYEMGGPNCHKLANTRASTCRSYGVRIREWPRMPQRTAFVISGGKVLFARYVDDQGSQDKAYAAIHDAVETVKNQLALLAR